MRWNTIIKLSIGLCNHYLVNEFIIETMNACHSIIIQTFLAETEIRDFIYLIKLNLTITIFLELKTCSLRHMNPELFRRIPFQKFKS
jgi:hypothetical protein